MVFLACALLGPPAYLSPTGVVHATPSIYLHHAHLLSAPCLIQVQLDPRNEEDPIEPSRDLTPQDDDRRRILKAGQRNPNRAEMVPRSSPMLTVRRQLQSTVQVRTRRTPD